MYHRRTSYASVAAGRHLFEPPVFPGTRSHLENIETVDLTTDHWAVGDADSNMDLEGMKSGMKSTIKNRRASNGAASYTYTEEPRFIAPSYLRSCRYLEKLHDVHRARLQHLRESRLAQPPPQHGLGSRTPSSTNLKQQSSLGSRTITQDVIERLAPPTVDADLPPLPSKWSDSEKCAGLEVLGDGYEIRFNGVVKAPDDAATVRTDHPIPKECGVYYFETSILSRGKDHLVGVGFSTSKPSLNRLPGWESESWGYHSDDGMSFQCSASGKVYGPKFSASDTVGCGINFRNGTAFFTKNGVALGRLSFLDVHHQQFSTNK